MVCWTISRSGGSILDQYFKGAYHIDERTRFESSEYLKRILSITFVRVNMDIQPPYFHIEHNCDIFEAPCPTSNHTLIAWNETVMTQPGPYSNKIQGKCPIDMLELIKQPKATSLRYMFGRWRKNVVYSLTLDHETVLSLCKLFTLPSSKDRQDNVIHPDDLNHAYPLHKWQLLNIDELLNGVAKPSDSEIKPVFNLRESLINDITAYMPHLNNLSIDKLMQIRDILKQ